jgi:hypothetical protein
MKSKTCFLWIGSLFVALAAFDLAVLGQGAPGPGPEHEVLKKMEGTWNAVMKMEGSETTATATFKMELGGMWLLSEFRGEFFGQPYQGRGADGYDPEKKKYVSVWVDSMTPRPILFEGTYDKEKKTMTMTGEVRGPDGKLMKQKNVTQQVDNDHLNFTVFAVGPGGEEIKLLTIEYTRKK